MLGRGGLAASAAGWLNSAATAIATILVPKLCLGTHCLRSSASHAAREWGRAAKRSFAPWRSQAELGNEGVGAARAGEFIAQPPSSPPPATAGRCTASPTL